MSSHSGESSAESSERDSSQSASESGGDGRGSSADTSEGGADGAVNYDEAALVELELDGIDYRLDSGRAGTALCISTRATGTWGWEFRGEARWQNNVLRCKAFDRSVLTELSKALVEVAADAG